MNAVAIIAEMEALSSQLHGMPLSKDDPRLPLEAQTQQWNVTSQLEHYLLRKPTCHSVAS